MTRLRRLTSPHVGCLGVALGLVIAGCSTSDQAIDILQTPSGSDAGASPSVPVVDAAPGLDAPVPPAPAGGPKRLSILGAQILDELGRPIRLRGANLEGIDEAGATELADVFHMNLVRLRISWEGSNRDDASPGALSTALRAQLDEWVSILARHRIWIDLEVRTDDTTANAPDLYTTTSATFASYKKLWTYLAATYKKQDYIAGYGLLAEPSPDKAGLAKPSAALMGFQKALMDAITTDAGDSVTPFFIGAAFNYDGLELWRDEYFTTHAAYAGRLVYEVNILTPKPWIDTGKSVDGTTVAYPQTIATPNYDSLLTVKGTESYTLPEQSPKVFNKRLDEPEGVLLSLTSGFVPWYLQRPMAFRAKHHVPLYVDQFGAGTLSGGQLAYEENLITYFENNDIHWTRWAYNAGSKERRIQGNPAVGKFYQDLGATYPHP